jgi:hypothetical protein
MGVGSEVARLNPYAFIISQIITARKTCKEHFGSGVSSRSLALESKLSPVGGELSACLDRFTTGANFSVKGEKPDESFAYLRTHWNIGTGCLWRACAAFSRGRHAATEAANRGSGPHDLHPASQWRAGNPSHNCPDFFAAITCRAENHSHSVSGNAP